AFRAINRAWAQGATVQYIAGRYAISGLTESAQDDLVKAFALRAERRSGAGDGARSSSTGAAQPVTIRKPRIGLFEPWTGSMDAGWTRWVLEQYGFAFTAVHPEDFKTALSDRLDVLILADDARVPVEGGGGGGRGGRGGRGGGGGRATRPEYA